MECRIFIKVATTVTTKGTTVTKMALKVKYWFSQKEKYANRLIGIHKNSITPATIKAGRLPLDKSSCLMLIAASTGARMKYISIGNPN